MVLVAPSDRYHLQAGERVEKVNLMGALMKAELAVLLLAYDAPFNVFTQKLRHQSSTHIQLLSMLISILACGALGLSNTQALHIANNPASYSLREAICAVEQIKPAPAALPERPTARFIAENPSRYSAFEVYQATEYLKRNRGE